MFAIPEPDRMNTAGMNFDPATGRVGPAAGLNPGATAAPAAREAFLGQEGADTISHDRSLPEALDAGLKGIQRVFKLDEGDSASTSTATRKAPDKAGKAPPVLGTPDDQSDDLPPPPDAAASTVDAPRPRQRPAIPEGPGAESEAGPDRVEAAAEGAVPEAEGGRARDTRVQALVDGLGAADDEEDAALNAFIDPEGTMPDDLKTIAKLNHAYEFYMERGDMTKAQNAVAALILRSQQMSAKYASQAFTAIQNGDLSEGAKILMKAYDFVPDGKNIEFEMGDDGVGRYVQKNRLGKVIAEGEFGPEQMVAAAIGLADGQLYWQSLMRAAKPSGGKTGTSEGNAPRATKAQEPAVPEEMSSFKEDPRAAEDERFAAKLGREQGAVERLEGLDEKFQPKAAREGLMSEAAATARAEEDFRRARGDVQYDADLIGNEAQRAYASKETRTPGEGDATDRRAMLGEAIDRYYNSAQMNEKGEVDPGAALPPPDEGTRERLIDRMEDLSVYNQDKSPDRLLGILQRWVDPMARVRVDRSAGGSGRVWVNDESFVMPEAMIASMISERKRALGEFRQQSAMGQNLATGGPGGAPVTVQRNPFDTRRGNYLPEVSTGPTAQGNPGRMAIPEDVSMIPPPRSIAEGRTKDDYMGDPVDRAMTDQIRSRPEPSRAGMWVDPMSSRAIPEGRSKDDYVGDEVDRAMIDQISSRPSPRQDTPPVTTAPRPNAPSPAKPAERTSRTGRADGNMAERSVPVDGSKKSGKAALEAKRTSLQKSIASARRKNDRVRLRKLQAQMQDLTNQIRKLENPL